MNSLYSSESSPVTVVIVYTHRYILIPYLWFFFYFFYSVETGYRYDSVSLTRQKAEM